MNNFEDTKELRRKLGLPIGKPLRYMRRTRGGLGFEAVPVTKYEIVQEYPSGAYSLLITTEEGEEIRILSLYFADMQSSSFE